MTKKQRAIALLSSLIQSQPISADDRLSTLDAFLHLPDKYIPDDPSLRHFVHDSVDLFLGRCDRCDVHHPGAARWLRKWRKKWVAQVVEHRPEVVWATDARLRYRHMAGDATANRAEVVAKFVGRTVREVMAEYDDSESLVVMHEAALRGQARAGHYRFKGVEWYVTVAPRMSKGRVAGTVGTALRLPHGSVADILGRCRSIYTLVDRGLKYVSVSGDGLAAVGMEEGDMLGRSVKDFWGKDESHPIVSAVLLAMRGQVVEGEVERDGHSLRFRHMPRYDPDGLVLVGVGGILVVVPKTEQKAEDWLAEFSGSGNRVKDHFRQKK
jgi:hypothetical protein